MANTRSAKKDARRSAVRALRNRSIKSAVKTKVTKLRRAIGEGQAAAAEGVETLALTAVSALDRAVSKGVLHRNNAARRKARLMKRLSAAGLDLTPEPPPPPPKKRGRK